MSYKDILGDDLDGHTLDDYNLSNEEEERLLADDLDTSTQDIPSSAGTEYSVNALPFSSAKQFSEHNVVYDDQEIEYRRRFREQEKLRQRMLRAKEVRRRKNAVTLKKQVDERERERHQSRSTDVHKVEKEDDIKPTSTVQCSRSDMNRKSPNKTQHVLKDEKSEQMLTLEKSHNVERARESSPLKTKVEADSTCEITTSKKPVVFSSVWINNDKIHCKKITLTEKAKLKNENRSKVKAFSNRRVVLQNKIFQPNTKDQKTVFFSIEVKNDLFKPNPIIFSRPVRTVIRLDKNRIVVKKNNEPQVKYDSDADINDYKLLEENVSNIALVQNLPQGMTDTRLKILAGNDVQNLILDKEERTAKVTFKNSTAAERYKKKFNNKVVAASRLTVILQ